MKFPAVCPLMNRRCGSPPPGGVQGGSVSPSSSPRRYTVGLGPWEWVRTGGWAGCPQLAAASEMGPSNFSWHLKE